VIFFRSAFGVAYGASAAVFTRDTPLVELLILMGLILA
jgi:hypothetical protein